MTDATPDERALDRLAAAARIAAPSATTGLDEMVVHAALIARNRAQRRHAYVQVLAAAAVLVLAIGAPLVWLRTSERLARAGHPLRFELPPGDSIAAAADADFSIDSAERARRAISLRSGAMLFDVVPLSVGETFEVVTPHLRAEVRGTVFEVRASEASTSVHVYEGHVAVQARGHVHMIDAGGTFDSARGSVSEWSSPLASIGRAAAARRGAPGVAGRPTVASTVPSTITAPEPSASEHVHAPVEPAATVASPAHIVRAPGSNAQDTEPMDGEHWMAEGDRRRVAGDWEAAVLAYEHAADALGPSRRTQAGYAAALLLAERLSAHERAFAMLDRTLADSPGSPVEEHALALRARSLVTVGRAAEARVIARRYVMRFPDGTALAWMERLSASP